MKIYNKYRNRIFNLNLCCGIFLFAALLISFESCENNPNDLGLSFIPSDDTTSVRFLDSETDSMTITYDNYRQYINTYLSDLLLVGNYQSYQSSFLLKFYQITQDYDSSEVLSASLKLRYSGYYFKDENGQTDFNIYNVVSDLNYSTITYDSVSSSDFGSKSVGNFSGVVPDSTYLELTIDNNIVRDWLNYSADTSYAVKNNGIAFLPNMSSSTIKGFYLINNNVEYIPTLTVIVSKNGDIDTLKLNTSVGLFLSNAPPSVIPPERFLIQNGIGYKNILKFDLTKLPSNVIINNANLQFTLDNSESFISSGTDKRMVIGMVTDSTTKDDSLFFDCYIQDSVLYNVNLNSVFQRWSSGVMPNLGITIRNADQKENLDNFAIFSPLYSDPNKRPHLKITYTLRN